MSELLKNYLVLGSAEKQSILSQLQFHEKIWLWQDNLKDQGSPVVYFGRLPGNYEISSYIEFRAINNQKFSFKPEQKLKVLSPDNFAYLECDIKDSNSEMVIVSIPKNIYSVSKDIVENWDLIPIEDEESNRHLRKSPRMMANGTKTIGVRRATDPLEETLNFPLYDMSQTGAGFLVENPSEFEVNQKLIVRTLDGKVIPRKIWGEVRGIREMEELGCYKVGLMFDIQKKSIFD